MSTSMIEKFIEDVDVIQVGARNMQNFDLLKELERQKNLFFLKRGLSANRGTYNVSRVHNGRWK